MNAHLRIAHAAAADVAAYFDGERIINLDANATAPTTDAVQAAVLDSMRSHAANPSSGHALGDRARTIVTRARDDVAALAQGAFEDGVVFTSGCTEANNTVLRAVPNVGTIITTAVEHSSILRPCANLRGAGINVVIIPVGSDGIVDLPKLERAIDEARGPVLVSIQAANSETGVVQPLVDIAGLVSRRCGASFHSDAAQGFGRMRLPLGGADGPAFLTVSGHKLHAPMGIGAIIAAPDAGKIRPLLLGGGQENGQRAGTQAVSLIAGFGAACRSRSSSFDADRDRMRQLRDQLEAKVAEACSWMAVNGGEAPRLPNTSNLRFPGVDGMALVANLDALGVMCSQGSACTSGRPEPSHVLVAMGLGEANAFSSIRLSVSPLNTEEEIDMAASAIASAAHALRGSA